MILNKNRLLFSLFEIYYLQYIENSVCLIFHDYSSLLLFLSMNVIHWGFSPPQGGAVGILLYTGAEEHHDLLPRVLIDPNHVKHQ